MSDQVERLRRLLPPGVDVPLLVWRTPTLTRAPAKALVRSMLHLKRVLPGADLAALVERCPGLLDGSEEVDERALFRLRALLPGIDVDSIACAEPALCVHASGDAAGAVDVAANLKQLEAKGFPAEQLPRLIAARPQMLLRPYMFEASSLRHSSGTGLAAASAAPPAPGAPPRARSAAAQRVADHLRVGGRGRAGGGGEEGGGGGGDARPPADGGDAL